MNPDEEMRTFFRLLQQGDEQAVIELRALNYEKRKNNTFSGYFDQEDAFVAAAKLATQKSGGVYCTINVCNPQLLSRRANRATPYAELTTSDQDIIQRRYLPIDLDPERPAGTSSSDEQHEPLLSAVMRFTSFSHNKNGVLPSVLILAMVRTCCCLLTIPTTNT